MSIEINSTAFPNSITVGDKFVLNTLITGAGNSQIDAIPLDGKLGDAVCFSKIIELKNQSSGSIAYSCTLSIYRPGNIWLPSPSFIIIDSSGYSTEARGDSIMITVQSVLPEGVAKVDIADIKGPKNIPTPLWPFLLGLFIISALLVAYFIYKRRAEKTFVESDMATVPPWDSAFQELDDLSKKRHPEFGRYHQFYFELSQILRRYIEAQFNLPALESTTFELEKDISKAPLADDTVKKLFKMFGRADLAKFAKSRPSLNDTVSDLEFGYELIKMTMPKTNPPADTESTEKNIGDKQLV